MNERNIYPNPANYPVSSFRSPVPPPDVDPDEGTLLLVAYNPAWQQVLLGALEQLVNPATWAGTDEEKTLALQRAETLRLMMSNDVGDAPTPYWDNETDIDDQEPDETQPWYGHMDGNTFIEDIGTWIVAGFIAANVSPEAAVFYRTFEKRFRLGFLDKGIAGFVHVAIDNLEEIVIALTGDEGDIVEQDFIGDPDLDDHTILQVWEPAAEGQVAPLANYSQAIVGT